MRLFAIPGLLALALVAAAPAAPDPKKPADLDDAAVIAEKLTQRVTIDKLDRVPLKLALELVQEKLGHPILLDYKAILSEQGVESNPEILDKWVVYMPAFPNVRLETVLAHVLNEVEAKYLITPDHVKVTSRHVFDMTIGPVRALPPLRPRSTDSDQESEPGFEETVTVEFDQMPFAEALKRVSGRTGRPVVIAADAADRARTPVTITLCNTPIEAAISGLAEAAGLRAYRDGAMIVVVSLERANKRDGAAQLTVGGLDGRAAVLTLDDLEGIALMLERASTDEARRRDLEEKVRKLAEELERLRKVE